MQKHRRKLCPKQQRAGGGSVDPHETPRLKKLLASCATHQYLGKQNGEIPSSPGPSASGFCVSTDPNLTVVARVERIRARWIHLATASAKPGSGLARARPAPGFARAQPGLRNRTLFRE